MISASRIRLAGLFLSMFGVELAILAWASNPTPFQDEWDADGLLLKLYLESKLSISDFFNLFNDHIIFFTRVLVLAIFRISGYWDVVLQMIINAAIHSASIVFIVAHLARPLPSRSRLFYVPLAVIVAAIPFGWENILLGFNTHFYLLILFSFASLACVYRSAAWSARWWLGTGFGAAAYFNMASGALTLLVLACVSCLQFFRQQRTGAREVFGITAHIALSLAMILFLANALSGRDQNQATSPMQFLTAAAALLCWPTRFPFGMIAYLPSVIFCLWTIATTTRRDDDRWFNVAALGWVVAQICAIAVGRAGASVMWSRYFDTVQIGMIVNFASALALLRFRVEERHRNSLARAGIVAWSAFFFISLGLSGTSLGGQIELRREGAVIGANNLRNYLKTNDPAFLSDKPSYDPYPFVERFRELLADPVIRSIIPPQDWGEGAEYFNRIAEEFSVGLSLHNHRPRRCALAHSFCVWQKEENAFAA